MTELLTTAPIPALPPNLSPYLAPWLRLLGFVVEQDDNYRMSQLEARWTDEQGQEFILIYAHYHPVGASHTAVASLHRREANGPAQCLVAAIHIRKLSEVRFLLLSNFLYKEARQAALASGFLPPISQFKKAAAQQPSA